MTMCCHNTEDSSTYNTIAHCAFLKFVAGTVQHMIYLCHYRFKVPLSSGCSTIFTTLHSHLMYFSSTVTFTTFRKIPI